MSCAKMQAALLLITAASAPPPPLGIHLAFGDDGSSRSMTVMWETAAPFAMRPSVVVTAPAFRTYTGTTAAMNTSASRTVWLHTVRLNGLQAGTRYTYRVDGAVSSAQFTTMDDAPRDAVRVAAFGDTGNSAAFSSRTLPAVRAEVMNGSVAAVLHTGDLAYYTKDNSGRQGSHHTEELAHLTASAVALMVVPGNAEVFCYRPPGIPSWGACTYDFQRRFILPGWNRSHSLWSSFNIGRAHVLMLDSEAVTWCGATQNHSAQLEFARADLIAATAPAALSARPWLIAMVHRPLYSSCNSTSEQQTLRSGFASLFVEFEVDVVLSGHVHSYERTFPVRGNYSTTTNASVEHECVERASARGVTSDAMIDVYRNCRSPAHIVTGAGGNGESIDKFSGAPYHWSFSAMRSVDIGYSRLTFVNRSSLHIDFFSVTQNRVIDEVLFLKKKTMHFDGISKTSASSSPAAMRWNLKPVLLPGAKDFVMTLYGAPSNAADLAPLLNFIQRYNLTQGLDPGPAAGAPASVYALLSDANFSLVQMYPGGDFEVPDGDTPGTSLTATSVVRMRALNRSNTTVAVGFGEFGYFFHCLHNNLAWWHDIYPNQTDFNRHKHGISPPLLFGYNTLPKSHAEAYAAVRAYVAERRADYRGWMVSMLTGYLHYAEMYAARWGAQIISMEIGEGILTTQSKIAFARGSSRAHRLPFSCQVSPWHGPSCTTTGPVEKDQSGTWRGAAAGHSSSFYRRMYLHAWFAGAAYLTPENSVAIFFDEMPDATHAGKLSAHGEAAQRERTLMATHARGTPFIPLIIIIDDLAGYSDAPCNAGAYAWGIFTANREATETKALPEAVCPVEVLRDLFEMQLWPSAGRGDGSIDTVEQVQLRPTPFGELQSNLSNNRVRLLQL